MLHSIQTPLFVFTLSILLISILSKWILSNTRIKKNLPPSPRKLPFIGNLHQLGSSPQRALLDMAKKHGPLMLLHIGSVPMLVASSAEAAENILKTHDLVFCDRPILKVIEEIFYGSKDVAFGPYGEHWRQMKSISVLHLLSNRCVQSFRRVREEETTLMIDKIGESGGSLVNLSEMFVSLANSVLCKVAVGKTYRDLKFKNLLETLMNLIGGLTIGSYIPWLSWVDHVNGQQRTINEVAKKFDELLEGVLEEHIDKKRGADGGDGHDDKGQDLVDFLLDVQREKTGDFVIDKDSIKAVVLDNFVGGTDTTSTNISWAVSELIRHPQVMKKLQQEVTTIANGRSMINDEDLEKMIYLKAVIKESLRLHIPLPLLVQRESTRDINLMGYDIPAGTRVIINAWALGRDPSLWEDSEKFKPERFLNSSVDYKGFHYQFIPFGAGRRKCPGIQFAITVAELAIANLVYKYDLALPDGKRGEELDMSEVTGLTTHRKTPLLLVATPRF